MQFSAEDQ